MSKPVYDDERGWVGEYESKPATHEPECIIHTEDGCMGPVALAYQRGADDASAMWRKAADEEADASYRRGVEAQEPLSHFPDSWSVLHTGSPAYLDEWAGGLSHNEYKRLRDYIDMVLRVTYRNGYNDHARSRAYAEQVYGPYLSKTAAERLALWDRPDAVFNQHGKGENP